jgi:hypothetical protein
MALIRGIAAVVAVLTLGGCAGVAGQAEPELGAQQDVQHPADRPGDAVLAALRKLDTCALMSGQPVPLAPHACRFTVGQDTVEVIAGNDFPFVYHYGNTPVTVGGAKAYLQDMGRYGGNGGCFADIPVSFQLSVQVKALVGDNSATKACDLAKTAAATVVSKLGNPDAVTVPASRLLADWDGCSLLAKAVGQLPDKAKLELGNGKSRFDSCQVSQEGSFDQPAVQLEYGTDPLSGRGVKAQQVGDKTADVDGSLSSCYVRWAVGPSGSDAAHNTVVAQVSLKDCGAATALAVKVQQALAGAAPSSDHPQRPLLYGANDPDSTAVGACADFHEQDGCVPYQPFTLPSSFQDWFPATEDSPAIGCAIAVDAVKAVYGDAFKPVVWGQHCVFVEPTHAVVIIIDVSTSNIPARYGVQNDIYANQATNPVAGKQAKEFTDIVKGAKPGEPTYGEYDVYVSPYNDITKLGMIAGQAHAYPARGTTQDAKPDVSRLHDLDQVMTKIIAKYVP